MTTKQHVLTYPCRGTRHWMEQVPRPVDWVMPGTDYWHGAWAILHLRCARCQTERHIALDYNGYILADKYDHRPPGYNLKSGEAPAREQVRLWLLEDTRDRKKRRLKSVK
jgi:hypothetical protein